MLTLSHDDYMALVARYQSQRDTLTPEQVQLIEHGESTALSANSYAIACGSAGGDAYNPTPSYRQAALAAADFATVTMQCNRPPAVVLTERQKVRAMNHRDREAYRLSKSIPRHRFGDWLWASDTPQATAYAATDEAIAWASKVLGTAA